MKTNRKKSMVENAYELLKEKIITLEFYPGMKLEEKDLIETTGIGRTPIREAIRMLISEGLIVSYGPNATYVKDLSLKAAKDINLLVRQIGDVFIGLHNPYEDIGPIIKELENQYRNMEKAISKKRYGDYVRCNAAFHKILAKVANNQYVDIFMERLYNEIMRLDFIVSREELHDRDSLDQHYRSTQSHHRRMIDLLMAKDFEELKMLYKAHIAIGQEKLSLYFQMREEKRG